MRDNKERPYGDRHKRFHFLRFGHEAPGRRANKSTGKPRDRTMCRFQGLAVRTAMERGTGAVDVINPERRDDRHARLKGIRNAAEELRKVQPDEPPAIPPKVQSE